MRDVVWMFDDEAGCLQCGSLRFRESSLAGVCLSCFTGNEPEFTEIHDIAIDTDTRLFGAEDEGDTSFSEWF